MTINLDPQLNDADLELLSAYLDRRLGDGERAALERRLSQEPVLRGALDELRATVALLHDLEPLKPPRSFTIAAPAAAPRRFWSFAWPAIGSALVALACLLTFSYALIRSSGGGTTSAPAPAAMQEAAAPTAAAASGAAQDSAMRQTTGVTAAPAAEAPMSAAAPTAAAAAEAPMSAAEAPPAAPAAEASTAAPAAAAPAAEAPTPTPAPTGMAAGSAGAIASEQPAAPELPAAADSAAPTAAAPPAGAALKGTAVPAQQPYNALVATSEISSPGTVALEQPPVAPAANSTPSGGSSNVWLIAGIAVLLLIVAGIGWALRRKA
jgi:hypothetical protein